MGVFLSCVVLESAGAAMVSAVGKSAALDPGAINTSVMPSGLGKLTLFCIALGAVAANALNIYSGAMSFLSLGFSLPTRRARGIVAVVFGVAGLLLGLAGLGTRAPTTRASSSSSLTGSDRGWAWCSWTATSPEALTSPVCSPAGAIATGPSRCCQPRKACRVTRSCVCTQEMDCGPSTMTASGGEVLRSTGSSAARPLPSFTDVLRCPDVGVHDVPMGTGERPCSYTFHEVELPLTPVQASRTAVRGRNSKVSESARHRAREKVKAVGSWRIRSQSMTGLDAFTTSRGSLTDPLGRLVGDQVGAKLSGPDPGTYHVTQEQR